VNSIKAQIQNNLNSSALIIRKYNLGKKKYFFEANIKSDFDQLNQAWNFAERTIRYKEIIKDDSGLSLSELRKVEEKVKTFTDNPQFLYQYLNSSYDSKIINASEKYVEQRVRIIIAKKYVYLISIEISRLSDRYKLYHNPKYSYYRKMIKVLLITIIFDLLISERIIEGFTPVNELTNKIHEESKYKYSGSICIDGTISSSQGSGSCSWHGGVAKEFNAGEYSKSIDQCRKEALKLSWIE
jgi:hypothetical protein